MERNLDQAALDYHRLPFPGKISVVARKPLANQHDLALAYSPGVAAACNAIVADPATAGDYTIRANLVAVVTNGTAVLGLGPIGPLAAKPVMEGKAVLFKKFAGIDVFDIEIDENDPERLAEVIATLEPSFGAINLEDIRGPDCFVVESTLRERMNIPVFHDDQHGTAIVASAFLLNAMEITGRDAATVKVVSTGGGAAGISCLNLICDLGVKRENITLVDHVGVVFEGRTKDMNPYKAAYARDTKDRTLDDAIAGADIFLGLSAPGILSPEMVDKMAKTPIILALANPQPEILPEVARKVRPDAILATGRSDYPNQVNNVLCFPFIFRGALDVGATTINEAMKAACVRALADLAKAESSEIVTAAYSGKTLTFGPEYLIPRPFDPRLIVELAPAVAKAAMDSGVATRPIEDFERYRETLGRFVFRSGMLMKPVFEKARRAPKRLVMAEGESHRVLRATQTLLDEKLAVPVLVGRPEVVTARIAEMGLRLKPERDFELVNPSADSRYRDYWTLYHEIMERRGVSPEAARTIVRTNTTAIAALMVRRGEADTMICGTYGEYLWHLRYVENVLGLLPDVKSAAALSILVLPKGTFFFCDTHVAGDPDAGQIDRMIRLAAAEVRRFGLVPKVALISHSSFGTANSPTARKMRAVLELIAKAEPELEVEGEMPADAAVDEEVRLRLFPHSRLRGEANLLVFPTLDAANASFNLLKSLGDGQPVGPVLLGISKSAHIVTPAVTARGMINMAALAVADVREAVRP